MTNYIELVLLRHLAEVEQQAQEADTKHQTPVP